MTEPTKLNDLGSNVELGVWLPIETAPKDGTKILAFDDFNEIMVVRYVFDSFFECGEYQVEPTHWMPLPEAPNIDITGARDE